MFESDAGHADAELIVGAGEAGQFVFIGPGEIIAVVYIGGPGNDVGVQDGGGRGGEGGEEGGEEGDQQEMGWHGVRFWLNGLVFDICHANLTIVRADAR